MPRRSTAVNTRPNGESINKRDRRVLQRTSAVSPTRCLSKHAVISYYVGTRFLPIWRRQPPLAHPYAAFFGRTYTGGLLSGVITRLCISGTVLKRKVTLLRRRGAASSVAPVGPLGSRGAQLNTKDFDTNIITDN